MALRLCDMICSGSYKLKLPTQVKLHKQLPNTITLLVNVITDFDAIGIKKRPGDVSEGAR